MSATIRYREHEIPYNYVVGLYAEEGMWKCGFLSVPRGVKSGMFHYAIIDKDRAPKYGLGPNEFGGHLVKITSGEYDRIQEWRATIGREYLLDYPNVL